MDYPNRRRIKIWGRADVVEGDEQLLNALADPDYGAKLERAIRFRVEAWDVNCPQHIPPRYTVEAIGERVATRERDIDLASILIPLKRL